ncbi:MAG: hypothetical protein DMG80_08880 [Acidobacteria bacterium]|nr:MAG: hypothetical protein DMG80_08880 [Acidobacteriota bacterium]
MMMPFLQLAPLAAERVINVMPGGLLIASLAWVLSRVVGRQNSGTRFVVWFCALLAVAGLPFAAASGKTSHSAVQSAHSEIVLPGAWAVGIFAVWMSIAALATARIIVGLWKLRRLRSEAVPLVTSDFPIANSSPAIQTLSLQAAIETDGIQDVISQFQNTRRVAVCRSSAVGVPTAIGFFRPAILIPEWVLRDLSAEELKVVLLHEFAHLRRFDDWTNLAQKLVRTVFFFHPAVWWIERRLSLEREMACDEAVLAETENPRAYAECLVSLAEKSFVRRGLALTQAVVGRARETSLRLARILDGKRPNSSRFARPALGLAAALAVGCVIALPNSPSLIAFESGEPSPATALASTANASLPTTRVAAVPVTLRTSVPVPAAKPKRMPTATLNRTTGTNSVLARRQKKIEMPLLSSVVPAMEYKNLYRSGQGGMLVNSNAHEKTAAPQLQLVMQMTQYDEGGAPVMQFSVWRVTFESGNRQAVRQELIVRSL